MEVTNTPPGLFAWYELQTSDSDAAKSFYTGLFGWTWEDSPIGPDEFYTMLKLNGKNVSALHKDTRSPAPPHWNCYISTDNADNTASKAKSLGGNVIMEPFDVMTHGRMAVIQDPTGAVFCIWEPKTLVGVGIIDEPGATCWTELMTTDKTKALAFYSGLFGWTANTGDERYTELSKDGKMFGGMMNITTDMGPIPPNWSPYFQVTDCDSSLAKATELGGNVCMGPMEVENTGRMGAVADPQGAMFNIIQLK